MTVMFNYSWTRVQSHRMECYAIAALSLALLGFSHMLGYWPYGLPAVVNAALPAVKAADGQQRGGDMSTADTVWRVVFFIGILAAGLFFYLGRRAGSIRVAKGESFPMSPDKRPLFVASARWGISGDAYKDVTDIVRSHAKLDSVDLPVSKGVFGDPYPGTPKRLIVDYYFARKWWVEISEGKTLELPEKIGQEQAWIETEKAKARLTEMTRGSNNPNLSYLEQRAYADMEVEFKNMPWAEKVAMKLLCEGIKHEQYLCRQLELMGFGQPDNIMKSIITGLKTRGLLVETKPDGTINLNQARLRDAEEIVTAWNFAITPYV